MKTDLFQSVATATRVSQICWHIECDTFTASSFRIWNSSAGIPSPPLALFIVMLSKAHLNSHSRMSGSRWMITPLWLSESWRSFLYSPSVYPCYLFLSSVSVRSISFLSFIVPIFAWNIPLVSLIFLKRSLVFPRKVLIAHRSQHGFFGHFNNRLFRGFRLDASWHVGVRMWEKKECVSTIGWHSMWWDAYVGTTSAKGMAACGISP